MAGVADQLTVRKALISLAVGPHEELLDIALPSMRRFADLHGYEILVPELEVCRTPGCSCSRPPSWWKVPFLATAFDATHGDAAGGVLGFAEMQVFG